MHSGCLHFFSQDSGPAQFNCAAASESTHSADFALIFPFYPPSATAAKPPNPVFFFFFFFALSNTICCPVLGLSNSKTEKKRRVGQGPRGKEQVWVRKRRTARYLGDFCQTWTCFLKYLALPCLVRSQTNCSGLPIIPRCNTTISEPS